MVYLVDYENVSNAGLSGVTNLTQGDSLIIFYSKNSSTISIQTHIELGLSKANIEYIEVNANSKNALDFQLSTYLGALIKEFPTSDFAIISKDTGYNALVNFWENRNKKISLYTTLNKTEVSSTKQNTPKPKAQDKTSCEVRNLLQGSYSDKIAKVTSIIKNNKKKQDIHCALVKEYKQQIGANIYRIIKPILADKQ